MKLEDLVLGMEVICSDGLGRVEEVKNDFPFEWVRVKTYINNRSCCWAPHNVTYKGEQIKGKF
jgi:hypothetical protein